MDVSPASRCQAKPRTLRQPRLSQLPGNIDEIVVRFKKTIDYK